MVVQAEHRCRVVGPMREPRGAGVASIYIPAKGGRRDHGVRLPMAFPMIVASTSLAIGVLLYLLTRPAGSVYLLSSWFDLPSLALPSMVGGIGYQLPSLLHTLAFSLFTYLCLVPGRHAAALGAMTWIVINAALEVAQAPGAARWIAEHTPDEFASIPLLQNIPDYFTAGTFDVLDLVAIVAGGMLAYVTTRFSHWENASCGSTRPCATQY